MLHLLHFLAEPSGQIWLHEKRSKESQNEVWVRQECPKSSEKIPEIYATSCDRSVYKNSL